jgi:DNA-damage-inducible protein J
MGGVIMAQTTFSVRMDSEVKSQLDEFCAQVGMNTTVAFNMFARAVLREKKLPFEVTTEADPFYSENNLRVLRESIAQLNDPSIPKITKTMEELEAMEQ